MKKSSLSLQFSLWFQLQNRIPFPSNWFLISTLLILLLWNPLLGFSANEVTPSGGQPLVPKGSKTIVKSSVSLGLPQEKLNFTFDESPWEQVENKNYGNSWRITFIPKGETLSTTPESFSYQFLERKGVTLHPIHYYKGFVKDAETQSPEFSSTLLHQSKQDILFKWDVLGHPGKQDFMELQRFIVGPKGYHIIRYSYRGQKMPESQEKTWRKLLQKAELKTQ